MSFMKTWSIKKKKEPVSNDADAGAASASGNASAGASSATASSATASSARASSDASKKSSSPVKEFIRLFSRSSSTPEKEDNSTSQSDKSPSSKNGPASSKKVSNTQENVPASLESIPTILLKPTTPDDQTMSDKVQISNTNLALETEDGQRRVSFDTNSDSTVTIPGRKSSHQETKSLSEICDVWDVGDLSELFKESESVQSKDKETTTKNKKKQPKIPATPARPYEEELKYLTQETEVSWRIHKGFVENMKVDGIFFVNKMLREVTFEELRESASPEGKPGGFIPALKQIANVAALPGIVKYSIGLPDLHSGYGFAIGNTAAFDMDDPDAIVSPGGVGFDINCGIRLIRTNLTKEEVEPLKETLAQALFDHIPVGVGARGSIPVTNQEIDEAIVKGMDWCVEKGFAWPEDRLHCEEQGRMPDADASKVSLKAKQRGLPQLGTLGAGNHYGEVQYVDEIFDPIAAKAMGITKLGQIVLMVHCGSRGFGHQVATDALVQMEKAMARDNLQVNDRQLACAKINSQEGQDYLAAMSAAANFAWVNRASITFSARKAFSQVFKKDPREMDMHLVYDVSHNIAKVEEHIVDGVKKKLLVHRKGSTRAFPPRDPRIPEDYQEIGQPVLIGGTMGTCSYVLTGTEKGMQTTFGSTCHGAGRLKSRAKSRRDLDSDEIHKRLAANGICVKVASPKLIMEEAPESYKDVVQVIETCDIANISKKAIKLKPLAVIKG